MRRLVENRRDFASARKLREVFVDRPMKKVIDIGWDWPASMEEVGVCSAVMYSSDKWRKVGDFEDYKHINESSQESHRLLIGKSFDLGLDVYCERQSLKGMPDTIAELANILGLQFRLYDRDGNLGDQDYQVNIVRAKLGAAQTTGGEQLLLVYTPSVLCCVITGFRVEKDGIVQ